MMNALFDPNAFKLATRELWDKHPNGWNDQSGQIRGWLREATDAVLAMADVGRGTRVLDVGAGASEQTLDIARRVGPTGAVLATDLSPAILAVGAKTASACRRGSEPAITCCELGHAVVERPQGT